MRACVTEHMDSKTRGRHPAVSSKEWSGRLRQEALLTTADPGPEQTCTLYYVALSVLSHIALRSQLLSALSSKEHVANVQFVQMVFHITYYKFLLRELRLSPRYHCNT
jgi:hypothetical protein